jgi:hypothetical protein
MTIHTQSDDFDIAKGIFDQLKELPTERQQRILRWIAEGLGVTSVGSPVAPPPSVSDTNTGIPQPSFSPPSQTGGGGHTDIKTFIAAKSPKSDNQFAAAVAYFYRFEAPPAQKRDSIDGDSLQEAARLAGRRRLANPRKTLNNAKAAGYVDSNSPGEFTINSVGENLVAMTLPSGTDLAGAKGRTRSKVGRKKKTASKKR